MDPFDQLAQRRLKALPFLSLVLEKLFLLQLHHRVGTSGRFNVAQLVAQLEAVAKDFREHFVGEERLVVGVEIPPHHYARIQHTEIALQCEEGVRAGASADRRRRRTF